MYKRQGKCYLFIDEVQDIISFEKALRGLLADGRYDIYCTGSNARMLSGELATFLSGRYVDVYKRQDKERLAEENLFIYTTYTESPADAIARYMIANRDKFAPAIRSNISDRIKELYKMDVLNYLTARIPFNQQQYDIVKKGVMDLGLNKDGY